MVKSYLRYKLSDTFGTINTPSCKSISLISPDLIATGTNEIVSITKCRTGDVKCKLEYTVDEYSTQSLVTCFLYTQLNDKLIYVGYANGSIRRFNISSLDYVIYDDFCFNGHKSAVTCLDLSFCGSLLASGSQDCDIVIWKASGDSSLFRLQGHKNEVTSVKFLRNKTNKLTNTDELLGFLISVSKDCIIRIWDLSSQLCIQTIVDASAELYTIAINKNETRLFVGGVESKIRYYKLDMSGDICDDSLYKVPIYCKELPSIKSQRGKCTNISLMYERDGDRGLLLCTVGKFVQVYRIFNNEEINKRYDRRMKRIMEKKKLKCKNLRQLLKATGHNITQKFNNIDDELNQLEFLLKGRSSTSNPPHEVQSNSVPLAVPPEVTTTVGLADSSSNSLPVNGNATPGDRGDVEGHVMNVKGERSTGPQVEPAADLREAEGQLNREATTASGTFTEKEIDEDESVLDEKYPDEILYMFSINGYEKIVSFNIYNGGFILGHDNNSVSIWRIPLDKYIDNKNDENLLDLCERVYNLNNIGHLSWIKNIKISNDNKLIISLSNDCVKLWNVNTLNCTKTIECNDIKDLFIVNDNKYLICGTINGILKIIYIDSCLISDISQYKSDIIAIVPHPNHHNIFAVAYKNKNIIFYKINNKKGSENINLTQEKTLTTSDIPINIIITLNGRYVIVSLEDMTIQLYYYDSLKVFLTLYGHKLSITNISSSTDSTLLASCSLDKTIKIWGLDFGNIHKSLLVGSKPDIKCEWIYDTHYLVSVGMDSIIKIWDCDEFVLITLLRGNNRPIKSLSLSNNTLFFVISGDDYTIRLWKRTNEQVFIEEEQEKELELQIENDINRTDINQTIPIDKDNLINKPIKNTLRSIKAAEVLIEILNDVQEYESELANRLSVDGDRAYSDIKNSIVAVKLFNRTPQEHVINTLYNIDHNIIYEVIISLPFIYAEKLLNYIIDVLESYKLRLMDRYPNGIEYICRIALIILQIYFRQFSLISNHHALISRFKAILPSVLKHEMDQIAYNKSALEYLKTLLISNDNIKRLRN